jgi:hypothetical protein
VRNGRLSANRRAPGCRDVGAKGSRSHPGQRRSLDADRSGHLGAQVVEVDVEHPQHPPLVGGERCRLEIRQQVGDLLHGALFEETRERELGPEQPDRGHEELHLVASHLGGSRRHRSGAELHETQTSVVDDQVLLVELAVHESAVVQGVEQLPQPMELSMGLDVIDDRVGRLLDVAEAVGWNHCRPSPRSSTRSKSRRSWDGPRPSVRTVAGSDRCRADAGRSLDPRRLHLIFMAIAMPS